MPTIEKGIDIPKSKTQSRWKFADMNQGDCMVLESLKDFKQAQSAAYMYANRNNSFTFTCRQDGDGGRIWREK